MTVEPTPGIICDRLGCLNPGIVPGVATTEDGDSWGVVICATHAADQAGFTRETAVVPTPGTTDTDVDRLAEVASTTWYADQGDAGVRGAWRRVVRAVLAAARPSVMSSALDGGLVLTARCENVSEPDGIPCTGALRYHWGQPEAACDTCGGRCGIAVAAWTSVAAARPSAPPATAAPEGACVRQSLPWFDPPARLWCATHSRLWPCASEAPRTARPSAAPAAAEEAVAYSSADLAEAWNLLTYRDPHTHDRVLRWTDARITDNDPYLEPGVRVIALALAKRSHAAAQPSAPAAPEELREAVASSLRQLSGPWVDLADGGEVAWDVATDTVLAVTQAAQEAAVAAARAEARREALEEAADVLDPEDDDDPDTALVLREVAAALRRLAAGEQS